jgi:folate-dependent phosphoribosylglycinamide formyltransferase PurN
MKERILWLGGNHKRHLYYINSLADKLNIVGGIVQIREHSIPPIPDGLGPVDAANWREHFNDREDAENKYFGEQKLPDVPLLKVDRHTLNDSDSIDFVKRMKPDMAIIFGTGMVRDPLISNLPKDTVNLHLGLSPRYRGAATLFWPFYFQEPNFAGTTFHYIENSPDAGDIIHQVVPELEKGDGIHDVSCKAVVKSTIEAVALFQMDGWTKFKQKPESGKNFLESDFYPQHLRVIYQQYGGKMVDAYLDGRIKPKEPKLKRQF